MLRRSSRSRKHRLYSTKCKNDCMKAPGACIMAVVDSFGEIAVNHLDALGVALPMFTARDDASHTPLYRASDLAHHYSLKSNIVGMYLARLVNRGLYNGTIVQMREFSGEKQPPGILKSSQYFCSGEVISSFVQYMRTRRSATATPRIGSETILTAVDDDSLVKIPRIDEPVEDEDTILDAFSCDPTVHDRDSVFVEELRRMENTPDCVDLSGSNAPSSILNPIVLESPSFLLIDDCEDRSNECSMFPQQVSSTVNTEDCLNMTGSNAASSSMTQPVRTENAILESPSFLLIDDCEYLMKFVSSS